MSNNAVIFVEEAWQVEGVPGIAGRGSGSEIIAVSPAACYALERTGLPFRTVEDYYAPADVVTLAFKVSHPRLEEICQYADGVIETVSPICRREGLKPFSAHQYKLMSVLDSVALSAFVLTRIVEAENPRTLYYFPTNPEPLIRDLEFRAESIYSRLIPIVSSHRGIEAAMVSQATDRCRHTTQSTGQSQASPSVKRFARQLLTGMTALDQVGLRGIVRGVAWSGSDAPRLLVLDVGFDVDPVLECLSFGGSPSPIFWDGAGLGGAPPRILNRSWGGTISLPSEPTLLARCVDEGRRCLDLLRSDIQFRALFECEGVDLFPVVERRLAWLLERNLPGQLDARLKTQALLSKCKVGAVLATEINSFARIEVARVAREAGVPVVVYQHGGAYGYSHPYAHGITALKWAEYFLAYGEGVAAYFNERREDPGSQVRARSIPVGSARLDAIAQGMAQRKDAPLKKRTPRAVYVCHRLTGRNRRIPYCDYDSNRYWRWQRQIVEVFRRHPEVEFVVRPFPSNQWHSPIVDYLHVLNLPNIRVETRRPFSALVGEADLFLLDFDGTSMLEALVTQKPIIVLADRESTWIHASALKLLEKRVVYARSLEEYLKYIEEALSEQVWREPVRSEECLTTYGTHLNDGKSAERAAQAIREIVAGRLNRYP